jgi:succinate dehydrogenase / fumarate reductase flavoprotein subunit
METITFGRRAGSAAAAESFGRAAQPIPESAERDAERELRQLLDRAQGGRPWKIRDELASSMHENFGLFRNEERMRRQIDIVAGLRERYLDVLVEDKGSVFNTDLTQALELGSLLDLAACMLEPGLAREESRGAHSRPDDFPERDDENFLRHSLVTWEDGGPELGWKPVTITKWEPAARTY